MSRWLLALVAALSMVSHVSAADDAERPRKVVLIAGKKSHGPGAHDYERTMRLLKVMLDNSNVAERLKVEVYENGWPDDEKTLDDADTIVFYSDGRDGDLYSDAPFTTGNRIATIQKQMDRGCGFMTMHFSTFVTDEQGRSVLQWNGGYFDWQDDAGKRNWYSKISQIETLELAAREHEIARGVPRMVQLRDEVYWKLRFLPGDKRLTPIWRALNVNDEEAGDAASVVGWAVERNDGGRGFGTSVGHAYRLWQDEGVRRLLLNAIIWTAKAKVPEEGVVAEFYTDDEVKAALAAAQDHAGRAIVEAPIRVLLFTGNKAHAWHNGAASTSRVKAALEADRRISVRVSDDIEELSRAKLGDYSSIVLNNYCNWHDPKGLSDESKQALLQYLQSGGGLVVVHFANGAFHYSLPEAGDSDWPEYREIVRRVWDHSTKEGPSAHDAFGTFQVKPTATEHPITAGLKPFEVTDELYHHQAGKAPIEPLIVATSKDTKREEPLAWAYEYEKARVFQTLLGHSEKTYDAFETREMLRRAVAWTARRTVTPLAREQEQLAAVEGEATLVEGKFGQALDARRGGLVMKTKPTDADPPLTVSCWTRLDSRQGFNILVASEPKTSPTHWELYTYAGDGVCSVYLPGRGGEYKSQVNVCDGHWHYVGFTLDAKRLQLFVDGKQVLDREIKPLDGKAASGEIGIGRLVEGLIGCDGVIDDVHVSRGAVALDRLPEEATKRSENTSLLLSFDNAAELKSASSEGTSKAPQPTVSKTQGDHWGIEGVGFKWKEEDSRDDRWKDTQIGPFLASSLPLGTAAGTVAKGLSIKVGDKQQATVCYDTAAMKLRAAWTGGFLKFTPARYGLIMPPLIDGEPQFLAAESPGWDAKEIQYRGLRLAGERVVLQYDVDGVRVDEVPWAIESGGKTYFHRRLEVQPFKRDLSLRLAAKLSADDELKLHQLDDHHVATFKSGGTTVAFAVRSAKPVFSIVDGRELTVPLIASPNGASLNLIFGDASDTDATGFGDRIRYLPIPGHLRSTALTQWPSSKPRWTETILTEGNLAANDAPYVVDTIPLPFDNPYKALFFVSGHDSKWRNAMAVCTVHGDVWVVSGLEGDWKKLRWSRYATGLFQPLGIVAKPEGLYVLGRDQITLLKDTDHNSEADVYECFTNRYPTSPGGHDYTTCLETDAEGNFYFLTANQGVWRLSADGQKLENLAGGLRNPNGLGVGPGPIITAAPQEGNWTPASYIAEVHSGDYFGYGGPKITPERPLGWTQPLCFIPRRRDNSSGGQVWATGGKWGPLQGQLLHFSYGQCRMMLVLRELVDGQVQGGTVDLPQLFESGAMRGRFHPHDGQLYVSGLRGWTTAATADGCLQRVRYTGKPVHLPLSVQTKRNGLAITFSDPLDRASAEDVGNYHLEQWNYRYAESYGSPDFKVSSPKEEGHDMLRVESATLLADDTVFLEINDLRPVNQLSIGYALRFADGEDTRHTIAYTIHRVGSDAIDRAKLNRDVVDRRLTQEQEQRLRPGLMAEFAHAGQRDVRSLRMAAMYVAPDEPASWRLEQGPFTATFSGFLKVDLPQEVELSMAGWGTAEVVLNGKQALKVDQESDLTTAAAVKVQLRGGYNPIAITYGNGPQGSGGRFQLFWQGNFAKEPIPASAFYHYGDAPQLVAANRLRLGKSLWDSRYCGACHGNAKPEADSLDRYEHVRPEYLAAFLEHPDRVKRHSAMPVLLHDRPAQDAADIAAHLTKRRAEPAEQVPPSEEQIERGALLYEQLNCLGCHTLQSPETADPYDRTSLHWTSAKYAANDLHWLLTKQHQTAQFHLSDDEAQALVAYLRKSVAGVLRPAGDAKAGNALRGSKLVAELRCNRCHPDDHHERVNAYPRIELKTMTGGCLSEHPPARAAHYELTAAERKAIVEYLQAPARQSLGIEMPAMERSAALVKELRCAACHNRDGASAARLPIIDAEGESGYTPELLPDLTWAGDKLQTSWIEKLFASERREPTRVWLKGRMPAFPKHAAELSRGLAAEHGLAPEDDPPPDRHRELIAAGEQLTHKEYLDCRQCHGIGKLEATGDDKTKLAPGINFGLVKQRVRHDYYRRFVLDPPRFDPATRMPKLAPDGRTTKVMSILEGDAERQFEAIWQYLHTVEKP
jgi:type 1 glutamine amidotransferase/cytochrome c553/glucose/arabinose dehydrogenase